MVASQQRYEKPEGQDKSIRLSPDAERSEEHTSELQSRQYLVCRLLLEKKKKKQKKTQLTDKKPRTTKTSTYTAKKIRKQTKNKKENNKQRRLGIVTLRLQHTT